MMHKAPSKADFVKKQLLTVVLFIFAFSGSLNAMDELENVTGASSLKPVECIEFGFVLLPSEETMKDVQKLAHAVSEAGRELLPSLPLNPDWGGYHDQEVRLPHVSIGQYAFLGKEYATLEMIVSRVAKKFGAFKEPIAKVLTVTDENIFLDFQNIRKETNPKIVKLYKELRDEYMANMKTKGMVAQALLALLLNQSDPEELALINTYYQNWGIPEEDRIRPHFTISYHYSPKKDDVSEAVKNIPITASLETIIFNRLGIAQIDVWGNPTRLLYEAALSG